MSTRSASNAPKLGAIDDASVSTAAESTAPTSSRLRPCPSDHEAATRMATASGSVVSDNVRLAAAGDTEKSRLTSGMIPWTTYSMANVMNPARNSTRLVRRYSGVPCAGAWMISLGLVRLWAARACASSTADAGEDVLAMPVGSPPGEKLDPVFVMVRR